MANHRSLQSALEEALAGLADAPVRVSSMAQLPGGASKAIWRLDLDIERGQFQGRHQLVLLRQLGGKINADALDLSREYGVMQAAYAASVPTPRPYWLVPDLLGRPAALVQRMEGETIGRRIVKEPTLAAARKQLPTQMGTALAAIHAIDLKSSGLLELLPQPAAGRTPAQTYIAQIEADLDRIGEPHPAIELCLRWLRRNELPPPAQLVLVHGDYRLGNLLVTPDGLNGVLDWEFAHIGDPHEDLMWGMIRDWRFGVDQLRYSGISQPEPFFEAYAAYGGFQPSPTAARYWEVMGNLRWATGCLNQAERHLSGQEPNLEFASLGRRAAEMELEALSLIRGHL